MQVGNIGEAVEYEHRDEDGDPIVVTGATNVVFHFETPSGVDKQFAGVVSDGANGVFSYTSALASDFDEAGPWKMQVAYELAGFEGRTPIKPLTVHSNLS